MADECTHDCSTCAKDCEDRDFRAKANEHSHVKKVIGVVSGKGGVGKSLVTALLACAMNKKGFKCAILDADITGPSIPQSFGLSSARVTGEDGAIIPPISRGGIKLCSMNFFIPDTKDPVIWRGPIIAGAVKQFWTDVVWGEVDYMFVDLPPGTGDVPLTVFQSLPVDAVVIVTSPQSLVSSIVEKAVRMAQAMKLPILGLIENMSYVLCPSCNKKLFPYGTSHTDDIARAYNLAILARLPMDGAISTAIDSGSVEELDTSDMAPALDLIQKL